MFKHRVGSLELRSCDKLLTQEGGLHTTAEIVQWGVSKATTVVYWRIVAGDAQLQVVGQRLLHVEELYLMQLIKEGFEQLKQEYG